jgi:hypothetical protein
LAFQTTANNSAQDVTLIAKQLIQTSLQKFVHDLWHHLRERPRAQLLVGSDVVDQVAAADNAVDATAKGKHVGRIRQHSGSPGGTPFPILGQNTENMVLSVGKTFPCTHCQQLQAGAWIVRSAQSIKGCFALNELKPWSTLHLN